MDEDNAQGSAPQCDAGLLRRPHLRTLPIIQYRDVIAKEPTVYVTADFRSFRIASPEEAAKKGWLSMSRARGMFKEEGDFIKAIAGIALLTDR